MNPPKTSPPTALWLLQSLQAIGLPPPGSFILGPTLAMSGKLRKKKKGPTKKQMAMMILWFFCKISGLGGDFYPPLQKEMVGGGLVAAPFRCVGHLAFLVVGMVAASCFSGLFPHPLEIYCDSVGFLIISTILANSFLIGRFLQKAKGIMENCQPLNSLDAKCSDENLIQSQGKWLENNYLSKSQKSGLPVLFTETSKRKK